MALSIPSILKVDNSEIYRVSVRLLPDGLSFSGYQPNKGDSFFYSETTFDNKLSYEEFLEETFYNHPFLAWNYKDITVTCFSPHFQLIPNTLFDETKVEEIQQFTQTNNENKKHLFNSIDSINATLLYPIDKEVYAFCCRSFVQTQITHVVEHLLPQWIQKSNSSEKKQMFVQVYSSLVIIGVLHQRNLLFLNSFEINSSNALLYFVLKVWQETKLDQLVDSLFINDNYYQQEIALSNYIKNIEPISIPIETFLKGSDILQVPFDVVAAIINK